MLHCSHVLYTWRRADNSCKLESENHHTINRFMFDEWEKIKKKHQSLI